MDMSLADNTRGSQGIYKVKVGEFTITVKLSGGTVLPSADEVRVIWNVPPA